MNKRQKVVSDPSPPVARPAAARNPALDAGSAQPLAPPIRQQMERALNLDFADVRVHTDASAATLTGSLGAAAVTQGKHIAFAPGRYRPESVEGRKLLAHELTHVAQPTAGATDTVSAPDHASEIEADRISETVAAGGSATPSVAAGGLIQRDPLPGMEKLPPLRGGEALLDNASPFLAAAAGSTTLEDFDTGKTDLKPGHQRQLDATARNITTLLDQYPLSTIRVIGHADTVGEEAKNLALGDERAAAVRQALIDLGVSAGLIETSSAGEGAPQAVKTRDETPNAKNRRVEVRFEPKKMQFKGIFTEGLKPPSSDAPPLEPFKPTIDPLDPYGLGKGPIFPPKQPGPRREGVNLPPDFWKPLPPPIKRATPKSPIDAIAGAIVDPVIDKVLGSLSRDVRDKVKDAARAGIVKGLSKGARAIAEANGVSDPEALEAIEKATEAAIRMKPGEQQP